MTYVNPQYQEKITRAVVLIITTYLLKVFIQNLSKQKPVSPKHKSRIVGPGTNVFYFAFQFWFVFREFGLGFEILV